MRVGLCGIEGCDTSRDGMVFRYHCGVDGGYHFRLAGRTLKKDGSKSRRTGSIPFAGDYDSGGREEGGITISRRPNKRPSREYAPGPSNASAIAVMIIPKATIRASCMPQDEAGNDEREMPRKHRPTRSPANGVKNPAARDAPLVIKTRLSSHLLEEGSEGPER